MRTWKATRSSLALLTLLTFTVTSVKAELPPLQTPSVPTPQEVDFRNSFGIPAHLGTVSSFKQGKGPTLIHIQTAHGNYEVQKNIQAILNYLREQEGINLVLVEGSAFKLEPEILRFFPDQMDLTMKIADAMAKKALVKGVELFLLENPGVEAYGIENMEAYRVNRQAFKTVLRQREQTVGFLQDLDRRIKDLQGVYMSRDLRHFLKQYQSYENGQSLLPEWFHQLEIAAKKYLEITLQDPVSQIDWPMLARFSQMKILEQKWDAQAFEKEQSVFLQKIRSIPVSLYQPIEKLLKAPSLSEGLPDPGTGMLFEAMVQALPEDFPYHHYPQIQVFIGMLLLQSEMKAGRLLEEMRLLTNRIFEKLTGTEEEKRVFDLWQCYRLLQKLFALELSPEEYEQILKRKEFISPEKIIKYLSALEGKKRKHDLSPDHSAMDAVFAKSLEFYRRVAERDSRMIKNIEKRIRLSDADKAVVITGGFHTEPLERYFESRGFNFASISPRITRIEGDSGRENYIHTILQDRPAALKKSSMEADFVSDGYSDLYGSNHQWTSNRALKIAADILTGLDMNPARKESMLKTIEFQIRNPVIAEIREWLSRKRSEVRAPGTPEEEPPKRDDSKFLYTSILQMFPQSIFRKDLQGRYTYTNQAFINTRQMPGADIIGKTEHEISPKSFSEQSEKDEETVILTGQVFKGIRPLIKPDGSKIYFEKTLIPIRDTTGNIVGIQGILWDVTEEETAKRRLMAEHAVTQVLAESRSLKEATPKIIQAIGESLGWEFGAIWEIDREANRLKSVNMWSSHTRYQPFSDITSQITFASGVGLPGRVWARGEPAWIKDVTRDSNFPRASYAIQASLHGAFGFPIVIDNQVIGVVEFFSSQIEDPDKPLLAMMGDIGIKIGQFMRQAETWAALKESEKHRRRALEAAQMGTLEMDIQTRKLNWSKEAQKVFGLPEPVLPMDYDAFLNLIIAEDRTQFMNIIDEVLNEKTETVFAEFRILLPDGNVRWISGKGGLHRAKDGSAQKIMGVVRDVTELKEAAKQLQDSQLQLAQSERLAKVGQLASGVAHEINNPLNVISGNAEMALRQLEELQKEFISLTAPFEKIMTFLTEGVVSNVSRIAGIVRGLLTFSRPTDGHFELMDIHDTINVALKHAQMSHEFKKSGIEIIPTYDRDLPRIYGQATELVQVFVNFLINAIHAINAMQDVEKENREKSITVETRKDISGNFIEVLIRDTGIGMDDQTKAKIYEPFFTTKKGEMGQVKGTGLGLAISANIIHAHGGSIQVESEIGKGTIFTLVFPSEMIVKDRAFRLQADLLGEVIHRLNNYLVIYNYVDMIPSARISVDKALQVERFKKLYRQLNAVSAKISKTLSSLEGRTTLGARETYVLFDGLMNDIAGMVSDIHEMDGIVKDLDFDFPGKSSLLDNLKDSYRLLSLTHQKSLYKVLKNDPVTVKLKTELEGLRDLLGFTKWVRNTNLQFDFSAVGDEVQFTGDIDGLRQAILNFALYHLDRPKDFEKRFEVSAKMDAGKLLLSFDGNYFGFQAIDFMEVSFYHQLKVKRIFDLREGDAALSSAYQIARFSGGILDAQKENGNGMFTLSLPMGALPHVVKKQPVPPVTPENIAGKIPELTVRESNQPGQDQTAGMGASIPPTSAVMFDTVLIADDEDGIRGLVDFVLKGAGVKNVLMGKNGKEAVELFVQEKGIGLVILDMTMPKMNGDEAAREIRKSNPDVPIVMLSGYGSFTPEMEKLKAEGVVQDIWMKPISTDQLHKGLKSLASKGRSEVRSSEGQESRRKAISLKVSSRPFMGRIKQKAIELGLVAVVGLVAAATSLLFDLHEKAIHVIELFGERMTSAIIHGVIVGLVFYIIKLYYNARREIRLRVQLEEDILKSSETIRESEAMHRTLIDDMEERVFYKDYKNKNADGETGFFVKVNDSFAHDFGFEPEELIGKTDYDLHRPKDEKASKEDIDASRRKADAFRAKDRKVLSTRETISWEETNLILVDGKMQERDLGTTKKPVVDSQTDEVIGVLGTYKDITVRKRQEQQLRESRALLQGILDSLPFVILERDETLAPLYANAKAAEYFGFNILADNSFTQGIFSENSDFTRKYMEENERIIKSGEMIEEDEEILSAGQRKIFHKMKQPLTDSDGKIFGMVEIYRDVTEDREMSDRLRHAEVLEANYQFASGLAHDTSNLLTGVLGNLDLASSKSLQGEPIQDEMRQIQLDIERMAEMIKHFRNQAQGGAESFTMLNLAPIVKQAIRTAKQIHPSKIDFKESVLPRPPYVMGNAHQIFRALLNVLNNGAQAIDHEASGKRGFIEIKMERLYLDQPVGIINPKEAFRPGTYIQIAVNNSGSIHPDVLYKMIGVLQGKKMSDFTTKSRGSGQGLKVIRQVVIENHGGIVDLKTDPREGTTFSVYFWAPNGISKKAGLGGKSQELENIWVIHDNGTVQTGIRDELSRKGYQVLLFDQARAALDFARESPLQKPLLIIYKEEEERRIADALKTLQDLFPGRPLQTVAVSNLLNHTGSWPKRPHADMENFFEQIGEKLLAGKKKTAVMPVGDLQKRIADKESPAEAASEKKLNILIVDDEEYVAKLLLRISEPFAAKKTWVQSGSEAVNEIENQFYDIVFLDLTFIGGSPLETAEKIREKWGSKTKIFITSGTMMESNSSLLPIIDGRIDKPFKLAEVAGFLKKIAQQIADEKKIEERSEIRLFPGPVRNQVISSSLRFVIDQFRRDILPLRLESNGPEFLASLLQDILGRPVYAEKAGIIPLNHETLIPDQGRIVATQGFQSWLRQTVESPSFGEAGHAIFDSSWLDRFLEEPRSLYLLLTSLKRYSEGDRRSDPLMAFVGDSLFLKSKIRSELRRQNNGLTAEEKINANLLLERLDEMVKFLLPEQVAGYVQTHQNGVAILRASHSMISEIPRAAHFILEPQKIHRRDVPAVALTLPALLKAAALIRGVPPDDQAGILKAHMDEIFPGSSGRGEAFVISFADYLAETLQKNGFIATQA